MNRPLKPGVWAGLAAASFTLAGGLLLAHTRARGAPGADEALFGLAVIEALLIGGVTWGFKTGFFGGSDD